YNRPAEFARHCEQDPHLANNPELFMIATEQRNEQLESVFLEYEPDLWSRMPAQLDDSPEVNNWKIERGMKVNQCDWLDQHQLHRDFSLSILAEYVRLGVNVELIDSEHQSTPLGLAARRGSAPQVSALLEAGADPNGAGADFAKPLNWARRYEHEETAALLTKAGSQE
ncbi:MAG: ankyrin repeat domain-containing protein, partial [Planctomycetota bacterium]